MSAFRLFVIILAAVAAVGVGLLFAVAWLRRAVASRMAEAEGALAGEGIVEITKRSNLFGVRSLGMGQVRGNGVLILTAAQIAFYMLLPRREFHVPLERVVSIEHPKWFLGKTNGVELLVVNFKCEGGEDDAIGIRVPEPRRWAGKIRELAPGVG